LQKEEEERLDFERQLQSLTEISDTTDIENNLDLEIENKYLEMEEHGEFSNFNQLQDTYRDEEENFIPEGFEEQDVMLNNGYGREEEKNKKRKNKKRKNKNKKKKKI
jgi:hypothetical protein